MPYIKGPNFLSVAEHRLLPTHLVVRTKPTTHRLDLLDELLRRVGKIQLLVFAVAIPLLVILDISGALASHFSDFLSVSLIGLAGFFSVTTHSSDSFSVSKQLSGLTLLSGVLQLLWLVSELSLNTPLSKLTAYLLPFEASTFFIKITPILVMLGISAILHQIRKLGNTFQNRPCPSIGVASNGSSFDEPEPVANDSWDRIRLLDSERNTSDDSSPHDSFSSDSSGALSTGLPSPTGFYKDEHYEGLEKAYFAAMKTEKDHDDAVYLYKFEILSQEEGMEYFFVHKKLSPIKTKIEDTRHAQYRPLLRTLIQQSKDKHQNIPAIRSVAKENMEGMCMLPCRG